MRFDTPVTAVRRVGDGVAVTIGDDAVAARAAVVAAAGWTAGLLEPEVAISLVPPITVTAESVAWFRPTTGPWPSFIQRGDTVAYGLGSPDGLVKAGLHGTGPVIDPDARPSQVPDAVGAIEAYARHWLPGVEPTPCAPPCASTRRAPPTTLCSTAGVRSWQAWDSEATGSSSARRRQAPRRPR